MDNNSGQYFVVQEGLRANEKIVLEGVAGLKEGAPIKPREVNADSLYKQVVML
jgi:membrane fusion protein (multidrug efflux system)